MIYSSSEHARAGCPLASLSVPYPALTAPQSVCAGNSNLRQGRSVCALSLCPDGFDSPSGDMFPIKRIDVCHSRETRAPIKICHLPLSESTIKCPRAGPRPLPRETSVCPVLPCPCPRMVLRHSRQETSTVTVPGAPAGRAAARTSALIQQLDASTSWCTSR